MLHTKFRGNKFTGFRVEDFLCFICAWKPSGHVTCIMSVNLHFHVPKSLHIKFG